MQVAKQREREEISTEEKIRESARRLFTERGYDSVKTRDIAIGAGVNSALVSYYFHGKENLYREIMMENFKQFIAAIIPMIGNENLSIQDIFTQVTASYIDMLSTNPDLPYFIINAMRTGVPMHGGIVAEKMHEVRDAFHKRMMQAMKENKAEGINVMHIIMNFMGLIIFPFLSKALLMRRNKLTDKDFSKLMEERKQLIPLWLNSMMNHIE